jgi:nitroimidazol reductase NimA-like FMN-containing flavoprotein (pyridoxamine 5'-phosphate oxidase superfamily)
LKKGCLTLQGAAVPIKQILLSDLNQKEEKMRRSDREITDYNEIIDILRRADTIRLGLHDEPYPYVVPLSFGFEESDGVIKIYFHGAKEGLKHDLIAKNPHVCAETDILHRYAESSPGSITAEYESFIGFGTAELVTGDEAVKGLDLLLAHCGYAGYEYDRAALNFTAVYRIILDSFTGKRRFL